jgi:putative PIN family toxin of toxin-antitoxin system
VQGVTLDTNVYVSALEFGGIGSRLIGLARAGSIRMDVSDAILDEPITVLRDDFHWDGYRMKFARLELERLGNLVAPKMILNVTVDPDDNRIVECAVEAGSDFLVTSAPMTPSRLLAANLVVAAFHQTPAESSQNPLARPANAPRSPVMRVVAIIAQASEIAGVIATRHCPAHVNLSEPSATSPPSHCSPEF